MLSSIYSFLQLGCLLYLIFNRSSESPNNPAVNIVVNTTAPIAHTDDDYICATLDLWPSDKCDYGACSWGRTSILNLDLNNQILSNAVKAFSPLKIRLGGTLQDKLHFQTDVQLPCNPFIKNASEMFGFTSGCLSMARWDEINMFFKQTGVVHTFGLNVLIGKTINPDGLAVGAWDPSNAEALMRYTLNKGYNIYGWELGNEVNQNGIGASITAQQYATDVDTLHNLVERVYEISPVKPIVLGPGGFFQTSFFTEFVSKTTRSLQGISHHMYNLGAGDDPGLVGKILDPAYLDGASWVFSNLQQIIRNTRTPAVAWVSEAGGAYNSGQDHVTNAFVMSFWYLDQLGMAATYGTKTYCRQSLVGGNYGLLNTADFVPNPDYYSAFLWHRLMGKQVLSTSVLGVKTLRAYTHCSKQSGITMLLINFDPKETLQVGVSTETGPIVADNRGPVSRKSKLGKMEIIRETTREEYHLTAPNGDLSSQTMLLNGQALTLDPSGGIPLLVPATVDINDPITVVPLSIVYVHLPSVVSDACQM